MSDYISREAALEAYRKQSRTKHRRPAGAIGRMRDYVHRPSGERFLQLREKKGEEQCLTT